jgi:hypothetical protein
VIELPDWKPALSLVTLSDAGRAGAWEIKGPAMAKRLKTREPRYEVDVSLKARDISKLGAALTFKIRERDEMLGTIEIGQGGFRWKGRAGKSFRRIPWARLFDQLERC